MVPRDLRLVATMLAFLATFATIGADDIPQGVMPKRQVAGTGASTTSSSSSTTSPVSSNTPTSNTPTTSSSSTTSQTSQSQQQSSTTVPTTVAVTTTNSAGSTVTTSISTNTLVGTSTTAAVQTSENSKGATVVKVGSTTINPSTLSHKTTVRQPLITHETKHSTYTSFWTSDGQVYSSVITTENVFASTTGYATATITPGLASGGGSGSNLSTNSKKVIGGVVGGLGGAVLIGGLAFVAWRLWGKRRSSGNEDGEYYDGSQTDSLAGAKRESMGVLSNSGMSESALGGTQTTGLERYERYQNPNGGINTASNF